MLLPSCIGGKHIYKYKLECYVKKITGFHLLLQRLRGWGEWGEEGGQSETLPL